MLFRNFKIRQEYPVNPKRGDVMINQATKTMAVYDGIQWVMLYQGIVKEPSAVLEEAKTKPFKNKEEVYVSPLNDLVKEFDWHYEPIELEGLGNLGDLL